MKRASSTATAVFIAASLLVGSVAHAGSTSVFVTIRNPGNDADPNTGYGAVDYVYEISQTAVSIAEWAAFYDDADSEKVGTFNSTYNYWNDGGRNVGENAPAVCISFHQAAQYANWLTSGFATEGAYTIDSSGYVKDIMAREDILASGKEYYLIPTEDEWYKAAYYDPTKDIGDGKTGGYWLYADGSDTVPTKTDGKTPYSGWNYHNALDLPWTVDSGTAEQNGTFNMMGDVWEWNETEVWVSSGARGLRGGAFGSVENTLRASYQVFSGTPTNESDDTGFRIARITPEPGGVGALVGMAAVGFLCFWRRR